MCLRREGFHPTICIHAPVAQTVVPASAELLVLGQQLQMAVSATFRVARSRGHIRWLRMAMTKFRQKRHSYQHTGHILSITTATYANLLTTCCCVLPLLACSGPVHA